MGRPTGAASAFFKFRGGFDFDCLLDDHLVQGPGEHSDVPLSSHLKQIFPYHLVANQRLGTGVVNTLYAYSGRLKLWVFAARSKYFEEKRRVLQNGLEPEHLRS